jgi:N-acetylglucosaminyldiphosphoundecaprenol N-acetyl-beta-D-mannosaminyltransferase
VKTGGRDCFRGVLIASGDVQTFAGRVVEAAEEGRGQQITFVNPHSFNILSKDSSGAFLRDLRSVDQVFADGVGVVWMHRLLDSRKVAALRFDWIADDLFEECARKHVSMYLLGAKDGIAKRAASEIVSRHRGLSIVGVHHGYLPPSEHNFDLIAGSIAHAKAQIVCVGAGAPVQERWAVALGTRLPKVTLITCGGYLDQVIWGQNYFPKWADLLHIAWAVRLCREPKRLWRRYLLGNPRFLIDSFEWYASGRPDRPS